MQKMRVINYKTNLSMAKFPVIKNTVIFVKNLSPNLRNEIPQLSLTMSGDIPITNVTRHMHIYTIFSHHLLPYASFF